MRRTIKRVRSGEGLLDFALGYSPHAPGFYLHLEPGHSMGGGGLWHPDAASLKKVRDRIVQRPTEWKAIRGMGIDLQGDTLKHVPAGYDPAHPVAEYSKLRDYYTLEEFSEREACGRDFMDRFVNACRTAAPLMGFLTKALRLPW